MRILNYSRNRIIFLSLMCFGFSSYVVASQNLNPFWSRVQFGGGIGLNFGDDFFSGTLAPSAIYRHNQIIATGVGLNGTYSKQKNVFSSTVLGGSIIALINPIPEIQLSTEFEELYVKRNFEESFFSTTGSDSYWYPALFLGIGYSTNSVTVGVRYDVLYDRDRSIYNNAWLPFFRFFF